MGREEPDDPAPEPLDNEALEDDAVDPLLDDPFEEDLSSDENPEDPDAGGRRSRVLRLARRLMDTREITTDTKEIIGSVIGASDRAKTEAVRMAAREVRNYLDELKLKDDLLNLMTSYSLEISISLKPLADALTPEDEPDTPVDEPMPDGEPT
jgi:hypothetical protein